MRPPRQRAWMLIVAAAVLGAVAWAAFAPVRFASREEVFEIPKGTWARRMAGNKVEILPSHVYLTVGIRDVLLLKNQDDVPQIFGPTLMMPGQKLSACHLEECQQLSIRLHGARERADDRGRRWATGYSVAPAGVASTESPQGLLHKMS